MESGACGMELSSRAALLTITTFGTYGFWVSIGDLFECLEKIFTKHSLICLIALHTSCFIIMWNPNWKLKTNEMNESEFYRRLAIIWAVGVLHAVFKQYCELKFEIRWIDGRALCKILIWDFFVFTRLDSKSYSIAQIGVFFSTLIELSPWVLVSSIVNTNHFLSSALFALISNRIIAT